MRRAHAFILALLSSSVAFAAGGSILTPAAGPDGSVQISSHSRHAYDSDFRYYTGTKTLNIPKIQIKNGVLIDSSFSPGTGDIDGVTAGYGLSGGGTSGTVSVQLRPDATGYVQNTQTTQTGATFHTQDGTVNAFTVEGGNPGASAMVIRSTQTTGNPLSLYQASNVSGGTFKMPLYKNLGFGDTLVGSWGYNFGGTAGTTGFAWYNASGDEIVKGQVDGSTVNGIGVNGGSGTMSVKNTFDDTGSLGVPTATTSSSLTLGTTHFLVLADATAGAVTLTLPNLDRTVSSGAERRWYHLCKSDSSANHIVIAKHASDSIDGGADLTQQYECTDLIGRVGLTESGSTTAGVWQELGRTLRTTGLTGVVPIASGGTNATSASSARTNLGVAIGLDVQAYDADLDDLADGSLTGSKVGSGVPAANLANGTLGAGVNVGYLLHVDTGTTGNLPGSRVSGNISGNAANVTGTVAVANGGTNATSASGARSSLGLVIGTDVQAYDSDLDDLADGSLTASKVGSGYPAANLGSGTLPSNVPLGYLVHIDTGTTGTLPATRVGAVHIDTGTTGTLPVARVASGYPAANLGTGIAPADVQITSAAASVFRTAISAGTNVTITNTGAGVQIAASGGGSSPFTNGTSTGPISMGGYAIQDVGGFTDHVTGWSVHPATHVITMADYNPGSSTSTIAGLSVPVIANSTYSFVARILYEGPSGVTTGMKYQAHVTGATPVFIRWHAIGANNSATAFRGDQGANANDTLQGSAFSTYASATNNLHILSGSFVTGNATGTLEIQARFDALGQKIDRGSSLTVYYEGP